VQGCAYGQLMRAVKDDSRWFNMKDVRYKQRCGVGFCECLTHRNFGIIRGAISSVNQHTVLGCKAGTTLIVGYVSFHISSAETEVRAFGGARKDVSTRKFPRLLTHNICALLINAQSFQFSSISAEDKNYNARIRPERHAANGPRCSSAA
jgi:hypothetical protein